MTFTKNLSQLVLSGAVALMASLPAVAQDSVTLTIHHFQPATGGTQTNMIEPWANAITEQSGGRITFEIYPSMTMGGRPNELYSQVRDGMADIVWTSLGYTPGVFRRAEVFELPLVHGGSARATTIALNNSMEMLAEDFKDVKVLFLHSHGGNIIHSGTKAIRGLDDLRGMKLRTPSRTGAWVLESWGVEPVGMPVPDVPQAMSKGTVDGALTSLEVIPEANLQELVKFATSPAGGDTFGTNVFMFAMNKDSYEALPEDLRAVIDANTGAAVAASIGEMWIAKDQVGAKALSAAGAELIVLSEEETARFAATSETVVQRWIDEVTGLGLDGAALAESARAAIAAAAE